MFEKLYEYSDKIIVWSSIIVGTTVLLIGGVALKIYFKHFRKPKEIPEKKVEKKVEKKAKIIKEKPKEVDVEEKSFNILKVPKRTELKRYTNWFKNKYRADKIVLINMELLNGNFRSFVVSEKEGGFRYKKNWYVLDSSPEMKTYNMDAKLWQFDYHETFSLPIRRMIPIKHIKETFTNSVSEVEYASNPSVLEKFIVSRIAEGIMKGQQIDAFMKQIRMLVFIGMLASVIHLLLWMQRAGFFNQALGSLGMGG